MEIHIPKHFFAIIALARADPYFLRTLQGRECSDMGNHLGKASLLEGTTPRISVLLRL
jgi:hypothetical protein